ncbi:hypothetical protein [Pseudoalteromonas aliena]|uniref:hypothetical protein n=1 Tax=Pseudoalteromonas aliena TaxID=247523 RepID=UPI002493F140|nr:hypothetical protein [Pseudoalteromonas aliena]
MLLAGPEMMIGVELFSLMELMGASSFVIAYYSGVKLFLKSLKGKFLNFERYSTLFLPNVEQLKAMPSLLIHAIPERTTSLTFLSTIFVCTSILVLERLSL